MMSPPQNPMVSVIVASYNYGHLIAQTLESLQAQTYPNWECIVVDDGSTDNTAHVVQEFAKHDSRIIYLLQANQGPAVARNRGIAETRGAYIQFLDADDLIQPKKFADQVSFLSEHPEIDAVYGSVRLFNEENFTEKWSAPWTISDPGVNDLSGPALPILRRLVRCNIVFINTVLLRRSVLDDMNMFDDHLKAIEDWDFWIRFSNADKRFQYDDREGTLAFVRFHAVSLGKNKSKTLTATVLMRKKLALLLTDPESRRINYEQQQDEQAALWLQEGMHGKLNSSLRHLIGAGLRQRRLRWLLYATALPFVSLPFGQRVLQQFRALMRRLRP